MPYIKKKQRENYDAWLDILIKNLKRETKGGTTNTGDTVYCVYKIIKAVYGAGRFEVKSNALKVLESAKLEYYIRVMKPYETAKRIESGDVECRI